MHGTLHRNPPNPRPAGVSCCGVPAADRAMFASEEVKQWSLRGCTMMVYRSLQGTGQAGGNNHQGMLPGRCDSGLICERSTQGMPGWCKASHGDPRHCKGSAEGSAGDHKSSRAFALTAGAAEAAANHFADHGHATSHCS